MTSDSEPNTTADANPGPLPPGLLRDYPWLTFLLPFVVYMLVNQLEPTPEKPGGFFGISIDYDQYPIVYTAKIAATIAAMLFVLPGYRTFPLRISLLAPLIGAVGVVVWVLLCLADLEESFLVPLGLDSLVEMGARPGFNPLIELAATPAWAYSFLAVRFLGLVVIVPVMEEFFIRGFVMRMPVDHRWWEVPFGKVTAMAVLFGGLIMILSHPAEIFAVLVWFSLVTWLMVRTRSMWDCVLAHAVTNLLLGIYVIYSGHWELM